MAPSVADEPTLQSDPLDADPFAKGQWQLQLYGTATFGSDDGDLYGGRLGVGYFVFDDISANLELTGAAVQTVENGQGRGKGGGGGLDVLFRWHALRYEWGSIYGDLGVGLIQLSRSIPRGGSHFNFTLQAGLGVTLDLTQDIFLMSGLRWFHISNSNMHSNPGMDSGMVYGGLMWRF